MNDSYTKAVLHSLMWQSVFALVVRKQTVSKSPVGQLASWYQGTHGGKWIVTGLFRLLKSSWQLPNWTSGNWTWTKKCSNIWNVMPVALVEVAWLPQPTQSTFNTAPWAKLDRRKPTPAKSKTVGKTLDIGVYSRPSPSPHWPLRISLTFEVI